MSLPTFKEIWDLFSAGALAEAEEKIRQLRSTVLTLQEENIALVDRVQAMREKLNAIESPPGDPCPSCRKPAWTVRASRPDPELGKFGVLRREYVCGECGFTETHVVTPDG